jgi:hypothetical protein
MGQFVISAESFYCSQKYIAPRLAGNRTGGSRRISRRNYVHVKTRRHLAMQFRAKNYSESSVRPFLGRNEGLVCISR